MAGKQITFDILARDRASKTFDTIGKHSDGLGGKIGKFGKIIGGLALTGGAALAGLGVAGTVMGVKIAAGNEQAQIAFETMLGSGKKARAFLDDLKDFAAQTPFEFPELQTAASSLISAGIESKKVIPIMRTLGDVTSGMGTGSEGVQRATVALQQMNAAGKITGEDLNQLRDAGIPVYDLLAKATGKSKGEVVKLAQAGKLGKKELDQMMKALESGKGLERFSGLMEKQSKSLTGLWSTFKDTLGMGLANAVEPLIPLLKDGLGGAAKFLGEWLPKASKALAVFMGAITGKSEINEFDGGLRKINNAAVTMYETGKRLAKWVKGDLIPALKTAGSVIMPMVKAGIKSISDEFGKGGTTWKQVGDFITQKLIPAFTTVAKVAIPFMVAQTKLGIQIFKDLWAAGKVLASILVGSFKVISSVFFTVVGGIINGAAAAFGWVPGLGPKLRTAAANFNAFRDTVNRALAGTASYKRIYVSSPGSSAVIQNLARIRWEIDHIRPSVTIGVANKLAGMRAAGGPVSAGRSYLVGERGPEIITPTKSGYVHPNGSSAGGGSVVINISGALDPVAVGKQVQQALLRVKRMNGGRALGIA